MLAFILVSLAANLTVKGVPSKKHMCLFCAYVCFSVFVSICVCVRVDVRGRVSLHLRVQALCACGRVDVGVVGGGARACRIMHVCALLRLEG